MVRVCAWCKTDMGEKEPLNDKSITHGMCKECADKMVNESLEEEEMGSVKDMPVSHIQDFQDMFNAHFKPPVPKKATKDKGKPKGKKGGKYEQRD